MLHRTLALTLTATLWLAGCTDGTDEPADDAVDTDPEYGHIPPGPELQGGVPLAGAAEGVLKLPVGTPLSGFTARCGCFSGFSRQDERDSHYTTAFVESTGVHIRPRIKAIWIENGEDHLVMTKSDVIYSFDGFVEALTTRLEELTGEDLEGKITHSANHNHSSYGTYSQHTGLYLGSDRFNRENFERMVEQHAQIAFEAYEARTEAALGFGIAKDWDPDNQVYSDRRGDNNDLVVWEDMGPEQGGKDPYMHMLRVDDAADGSPIAVMMGWGMHPYVFGEDNPLVTADATALIEEEVAESFDEPVVSMFVQTAGGDTSVRGTDSGWARMETVGALARDAILDLYDATQTSAEPIVMETMSRSVPMSTADVRVTRNGEVDWYYPPYEGEDAYTPDGVVYGEDGEILSPLDEWYTEFGAAFCGSGDFDFPIGGLPTEHPVYTSCMQISLMKTLVKTFFRLDDAQVELPLDGMSQVYTAASRVRGVPVTRPDGTVVEAGDVLMGFFPGEPVHMYAEQWRRRAKDELGYEDAILFGYAMDHEGYLLIPEDWMMGGYEPDINFQGPLSGEYIMEEVLEFSDRLLGTDTREPYDDRRGTFQGYEDVSLPENAPDMSPDAGTLLTNETLPEYFWIPEGFQLDLEIPAQLERIQGTVQIGWIGGDPGVDNPNVVLEREVSPGTWEPVRSHTGKIIDETHHDFGLGHTPDPLFPADADQTHYWWATWQAVGHIRDRPGLPTGTYRLHVTGQKYAGGATTWPWPSEPYEVFSDAFEVVPATITAEWGEADDGLWLSLRAPNRGFRMIDLDGSSTGHNPLRGDLDVDWVTATGTTSETVAAGAPNAGRTWLSVPSDLTEPILSVTVTDVYGNTVTLDGPSGVALPL